jgi:hypothetical protein
MLGLGNPNERSIASIARTKTRFRACHKSVTADYSQETRQGPGIHLNVQAVFISRIWCPRRNSAEIIKPEVEAI